MKPKRAEKHGPHPDFGGVVASWIHDPLALLSHLTSRGVQKIVLDEDHAAGQMFFWDGARAEYPPLEKAEPHGPQLARELSQALSGQLFEPQVPWTPECPRWHLELYEYVRQLPPGQITELPESLIVDGKYRDRRAIAGALRKCPLVPLVPLHRICGTGKRAVHFPWGTGWQEILLRTEKKAARSSGNAPDRPRGIRRARI